MIGEAVWWHQPEQNKAYQVRIRHLGELLQCTLTQEGQHWRIRLTNGSHRGVAAGQHAVLYEGDHVLGGGVIV